MSAAVVLLAIALVGIPPSVGFLGKWYIALGAIESGIWPVAAVILASTVLTLLYVVRLAETIVVAPLPDTAEESRTSLGGVPAPAYIAVIGIAVLAVVLGFAGAELTTGLEPVLQEVYAHG